MSEVIGGHPGDRDDRSQGAVGRDRGRQHLLRDGPGVAEVRLLADGELVGTHRTFPFQFRWTPAAADVGSTVTLLAEAEDKAGNVARATRTVSVAAAPKSDDAPPKTR